MTETDANDLVFRVIAEESVTADLDRRIRDILVACFPADAAHFSHSRCWHSRPAWVVVALVRDGTVAAHCASVERGVMVCGTRPVTVAGVQGFSVMPDWRGSGLSDRIMEHAIEETRRRGIEAGLLFCLPELEKVYARMGWRRIDAAVVTRDGSGNPAPLPEKNITMAIPVAIPAFPPGDLDLMGPDW
jgi:GNAT superfamily N-acetyltransferase